jgi:hypothetical protein
MNVIDRVPIETGLGGQVLHGKAKPLCKPFEFGMRRNDLFDIGHTGNAKRTGPIQWELGTERHCRAKSCA